MTLKPNALILLENGTPPLMMIFCRQQSKVKAVKKCGGFAARVTRTNVRYQNDSTGSAAGSV
jgi:hypothetical protein